MVVKIRSQVTWLVALAGLLLVAAALVACAAHGGGGRGSGGGSKGDSGGAHAGDTTTTGHKGSGGNRSVGQFTKEFAQCMRANGVPNFPDPNGSGGQLGPNSGIDPGSAAYLNAINGPCRSLAPPEWVSEGPGSGPTGPAQ
ncbi:MAG: hypothetical protein ACJ73S_22720 [Mycobacteriales bacterium]